MESPADKIRIALDLHRTGVAMHRLTIQRQHPELSAVEVELRLEAWLLHRPGAEHGDAEGRPRRLDP